MRTRKQRVVQGLAVLAAGALALAGCSSSSGHKSKSGASTGYAYGSIPAASSQVKPGGTVHIAEDVGADPNWIFPVTPAANYSVYTTWEFQYQSWRQLFFQTQGSSPVVDYSRSLTDAKPTVSNGGKTFTIKLNGKYTWNNGQKVSAQDVLFYYYLLKAAVKESPANGANYTPGQFPDNVVSAKAVNSQTVQFTMDKVYNPDWVVNTQFMLIIPMPSKQWAKSSAGGPILDFTKPANAKAIYDYLVKQSKSLSTYGSNPLWQTVDGPYKIKSYNSSTGAASFVANTKYTGEGKPNISEVDLLSYTSPTAEFNDLLSGKLDFGYVKSDNWPQLSRLKSTGDNIYGLPDFGFHYAYYNFKDKTNGFGKAISQLYIRQAFAHLQDQNAEIKGAYQGLAAPEYGPVGIVPKTPYAPKNALTNPYPYSVSAAKKLLTSHGWKVVPRGTTTCQRPGTGANECGAGIAKGQSLNFVFYYASTPKSTGQMVTAFASNLKQLGINATLKTDTFNNIIQNENVVSTPKNDNNWGMADFGGETEDDYPTTNTLFNTGGSLNQGGFSDPQVDQDIKNSMLSTDASALQKELSDVTAAQPGLFQPSEDYVYAWSPKLSGDPVSFAATTQFQLNPEDWYFTK
jgi:peptide/nickel transport system substrate-binding protein